MHIPPTAHFMIAEFRLAELISVALLMAYKIVCVEIERFICSAKVLYLFGDLKIKLENVCPIRTVSLPLCVLVK